MAIAPGTRIGAYEVVVQIGVGGMGEVYRALDTHLKRQVAIKVLPASVADDPDRLARFQHEAEVLAQLNHPNIAAIYGLDKADGQAAHVMELVEGPTLADRSRRVRSRLTRRCRWRSRFPKRCSPRLELPHSVLNEARAIQMPISDAAQEQVVRLLMQDLHATVGTGHDHFALNNAVRLRPFIDDARTYIQSVVDSTQQDIHDEFADTVWPKCPRHEHPLWFRDDSWWCEQDEVSVARLGELESYGAA